MQIDSGLLAAIRSGCGGKRWARIEFEQLRL